MKSKTKTNQSPSAAPELNHVEKSTFGLVGTSGAIQYVRDILQRISTYDVTVLIEGESGTGKELIARAIHYNSQRKNKEFVIVNCSAFSDSLLESELFGHMRGSFTGAIAEKKDYLKLQTKALFLDEVGDMSPALQVKLLRVLQEGVFFKIGGVKPMKVDVRMVAATNRDLQKLVNAGKFRNDLFYRLNVMHINIPPLRDRREDIPALVQYVAEKIAVKNAHKIKLPAPDAMRILKNYDWPGNVRELENELEKACIMAEGSSIKASDLSKAISDAVSHKKHTSAVNQETSFRKKRSLLVSTFEKTAIEEALLRTKGNQTQAAKALGISRQEFLRKLKLHRIEI